jgi:cell division protein YceG involved in septum cleavage
MKMKTRLLALTSVMLVCALAACSGYRSVERPDGTKKTTVTVAPGTTITGPAGGCLDTRGGTCEQQPVVPPSQ